VPLGWRWGNLCRPMRRGEADSGACPLSQAAAEGESPSRARTPLGPRLGQEGSPMRTLHLTEATQGPERLVSAPPPVMLYTQLQRCRPTGRSHRRMQHPLWYSNGGSADVAVWQVAERNLLRLLGLGPGLLMAVASATRAASDSLRSFADPPPLSPPQTVLNASGGAGVAGGTRGGGPRDAEGPQRRGGRCGPRHHGGAQGAVGRCGSAHLGRLGRAQPRLAPPGGGQGRLAAARALRPALPRGCARPPPEREGEREGE
jgi:hypothetical protein